jgi:uncharacterized membrane protein YphA (DoxX/SURF4 family)
MSTMSKGRRIAGWVLTVLLSLLFVASSYPKLTKSEQAVEMMTKIGLGNDVLLIGIGEAASALLFLLPYTHSLGLLLLTALMGGAIATHMQHGESYSTQSGILGLIWLTGFLRYPEVFQSFRFARPHEPPVEY